MAKRPARPRRSPEIPTATVVRKKPSLDFSVTGLVYCSMMMFMGLAAINSQANLLFGVFGLMIGILMVSAAVSWVVLRRLELRRVLPDLAVVGQPTTIHYEFTNAKRFWPSLSVCLSELDGTEAFTKQPVSYLLHAAPKMTASIPIEVLPKRRGLHELDHYQLSTSFPFGFIKRASEHRQKDSMLVYPALAQVDPKLLTLARSADTTGAMMRPRRGGMDEFYGVKEHRRGENPRWIYWKRSARTGTLVAKEMTQVSPPRLALLVDTYLPDRSLASHAATEKAIAMAASMASAALEQGLQVGVFARGDDGFTGVPPNRGKRHRRDVLAVMARLPLNTQHKPQELVDRAREYLTSGTTPVLLTPGDVQLSLGEHLRTGMIVISSASVQAQNWFRFPETVDFERCMPTNQTPTKAAAAAKAPGTGKAAEAPPSAPGPEPAPQAA